MHYYKRNIGDYAKKAGKLSMLQHGSYTILIDACYDREKFPTLEEAIDWTWASTTEEVEAVTFVLKKFFTLENGVYIQNRIKDDIEEYHEKAKTNKRIATEREAKRKENSTNRAQVVNEPTPNHKPITNNQEPVTSNHKPVTKDTTAQAPIGFTTFWEAYPNTDRKQSKGKCLDVWIKAKAEICFENIVNHVERMKESRDWLKNNGEYVPAPLVYLNQRRWEGAEPTEKQTNGGILAGAI